MEIKQVPIGLVDLWPKNPRGIMDRGFERLKQQIKELEEYKPLVVKPMPGGRYMVLGGNMRLRAYRFLRYKKVWVWVVHPKTEGEDLEIALLDNDRVGKYDREKLAKLAARVRYDIDLEDYQITVGEGVSIPCLMKDYGPAMDVLEKELDETIKTAHKCQECGYRW